MTKETPRVERWSTSYGAEFIEIHDPDEDDNPAAVLPADDARAIALQVLEPDLEELVAEWRDEAVSTLANGPMAYEDCADELEEFLNDV